jgi:Ca2+/Na+ antiporter
MRKKPVLPYLEQLWETDFSLCALLVFLLIEIFFLYPLGQTGSIKFLTVIFFSLILISGAITASRSRILRSLVFFWGLLTFVFLWIRYLFPHHLLISINTFLAFFYLVLLILLILGQALREGDTTSRRIMGAVAAYLLLGLMWSLAYFAIALNIPGAFKDLEAPAGGDHDLLRSHFHYFSFTVLTTVGFGDIVPVHPIARMAVVLEGVVGQLFPAILIARLVSLQVQSKKERKKS